LVLTARSAVSERVACLDGGADDFLSKPFAVAELRARVRALGRRRSVPRVFVYERPGLRLHFSERNAYVNGVPAPVTSREWSILELLAARRGRVVSRQELLEGVWGDADDSTSASLEVLIARIRKKLSPEIIRTVRGEGYAFEA
jgi:DNA-binding response OmpR family regulator